MYVSKYMCMTNDPLYIWWKFCIVWRTPKKFNGKSMRHCTEIRKDYYESKMHVNS